MTAHLSSLAPLPDGLTTRPLTTGDAAAVNEIYAELEAAEPADQHFDLDEVKELLVSPGFDLPHGSLAVLDGERVVAFAMLDVAPVNTEWKGFLMGGVRTAYTRRGIGRYLVETLSVMAEQLRAANAAGLPAKLKLWLPQGRPGVAALAESAGFSTLRYFFDMRRDLVADPPAVLPDPDGIRILPWSPDWDEQVRLAHNEAFADHWDSEPQDQARWQSAFADSSTFRPATCRIAVDGDQVVGYVLTEEFVAETEANGFRTGYIALVGTVRAARGRGVASALLSSCLTALAEAGYAKADLGVDADSPTGAGRIYSRMGFHEIKRNRTVGRRIV